MSDPDRRSALVVVAHEAEQLVREWRLRYLRESVEHGIPPHLTILFPFVAGDDIDDRVLETLRRLYAPVRPSPTSWRRSSRSRTRRGSHPGLSSPSSSSSS